jgi:hypothetical protein
MVNMALEAIMRMVHVLSVIALVVTIGGGLAASKFSTPTDSVAAICRPVALCGIVGLLVSGGYLSSTFHGAPTIFYIALGIKVLLALHVFAVVPIALKSGNPKRNRLLSGAMVSTSIVGAIGSILQYLPALAS